MKDMKSKQKPDRKCTSKRIFGFFLTYSTIGCCIMAIFIIAANQTSEERHYWTVNFIKVMLQDFLVTPLLYLVVSAGIYTAGVKAGPGIFGKAIRGMTNKNFIKIHKNNAMLFAKPHPKINKLFKKDLKTKVRRVEKLNLKVKSCEHC